MIMKPQTFDPALPFALLWDGPSRRARLFSDLNDTITADHMHAVLPAMEKMRDALHSGAWLAGGLSYECGAAFEPGLGHMEPADGPLLWFGKFDAPTELDLASTLQLLEPYTRGCRIGEPRPRVCAQWHQNEVARIQSLIGAGDIYQANLTFPCDLPYAGHPVALFACLFAPAPPPHAALVHRGKGRWWLSLSPELFFDAHDGQLTVRPMKGTAPRGMNSADDRLLAAELGRDAKNRAENLMITDLLRNDLSRVAKPGSVRVPRLWEVETYPTVHQMTSTIVAELAVSHDVLDVLRALFPCGSVTGAPKIRATEIIAEAERRPRGIYCGSIGWLAPGARDACFNVAIRTIDISGGRATLGLGSGIVADSDAGDEWRECLLKSRFLHPARPRTLIETMRREPDGQINWRVHHLERMAHSAARFDIPFDSMAAGQMLDSLPRPAGAQRVRLLLAASGAVAVQLSPAPDERSSPLRVAFHRRAIPADDWRLRHKSSDRDFHDHARRASGCDEIIWVDEAGFVTEGSFTNLFIHENGTHLTPPLQRGLLPGILRMAMLAEGRATECDISLASAHAALAEGRLFLGNALRGLMPATLADEPVRA